MPSNQAGITFYEWEELSETFDENLFLGNGASIAIDDELSYNALYNRALEEGEMPEEISMIFEHLGTRDFEHVLRILWHAYHVNQALEIEEERTERTYEALRNSLITTVREVHPRLGQVEDDLQTASSYMSGFSKVLSLNYDFLVYWAMMKWNEEHGQWFKDCFLDGQFETQWEGSLDEPFYPVSGVTLVFYPHGNLTLADHFWEGEKKIASTDEHLLDEIVAQWESGNATPLFVSEGTNDQKKQAIQRSSYLSHVYNEVLKKLEDNLVIYGWSVSDEDYHILEALEKSDVQRIAISVYKNNGDWISYCHQVKNTFMNVFDIEEEDLFFFEHDSDGCWIH